MAITECIECGGNVSTSAKSCPHCGAKEYRHEFSERTAIKIVKLYMEKVSSHLPEWLNDILLIALVVIYYLLYIHIPYIIAFAILEYAPKEEVPEIIFMASEWVMGVYNYLHSAAYELYTAIFD